MAELKVNPFNRNDIIEIIADALASGRINKGVTTFYHHQITFKGTGVYQGGNSKNISILLDVITNKKEACTEHDSYFIYYVLAAFHDKTAQRVYDNEEIILPDDISVTLDPAPTAYADHVGVIEFFNYSDVKWNYVFQAYPGDSKIKLSVYAPDEIDLATGKMKAREDLMISSDIPVSSITDVVTEL